ncbi:MAG TPA: class I SAM-dependent methyltransferase [Thermoguttaceae bacterium]|nr:class I SAM-dependent methyltransferase [Thermoguttaceae bacterium]
MSWQTSALDRWYYSKPGWKGGTERFHDWVEETASPRGCCLEIGAGPENATSKFLASHFDAVDGLDIDEAVRRNPHLRAAWVYDGGEFPIAGESYECLVADYVLEHVRRPSLLLSEALRVLKPGGRFFFRTPNLWHYVSLGARLTPHWVHGRLANWLRRLPPEAHEPYPTFHRMNARRRLRRLALSAGFENIQLRMIEAEPSYGLASRLLFYPFMIYERIVNSWRGFEPFRMNILGMIEKPRSAASGQRPAARNAA